jgi:hypothetical protein
MRMNPKGKGCESVDWMHVAQNMEQWRALVSTAMNLRGP